MPVENGLSSLGELDRELIGRARAASGSAYAPYSGFAVGAAVRARSGRIHVGANLENAAFGVVMCAEVAAITAANTAGDLDFDSIAVIGFRFSPDVRTGSLVSPCGRCRQIIAEAGQLHGVDIRVLSCSADLSHIDVSPISVLLPMAFGPASLGVQGSWPGQRRTLREALALMDEEHPC